MGYDYGVNGKGGVTVKDIAKRAGVAPSTVSRAMRNNPWIPPHTRARVKKIAVEMGYIPCLAARELKGRRSRTIGLCLSDLQDDALIEQVRAIDQAALEHDFRLLVALFQGDEKREFDCVQDFLERRMEGIVLINSLTSQVQTPGQTPGATSGAMPGPTPGRTPGATSSATSGATPGATPGPIPIVVVDRSGETASSNYLAARDAFDTLLQLMLTKN